jgi:hypothetical protein
MLEKALAMTRLEARLLVMARDKRLSQESSVRCKTNAKQSRKEYSVA